MSGIAIRVESLSKCYVLGGEADQNQNFRELIIGAFTQPLRRLRRLQGEAKQQSTFWALKDLSFEIARGEVVGIIGANGAGKTTLLKILSRITAPTAGAVHYKGRIASLLEVGTGFHPELSGRENIYINGAILGMTKLDIRKRFDDIVEFSGIRQFLDTPVKRYSSGLYVRLAFAVAAHMDPDILIVDEVLAVGDAEFQKKCLGRMQSIAKQQGKTVLFVSHNLDAIQRICSEAIYLKEGKLVYQGNVLSAIEAYLSRSKNIANESDISSVTERWGTGKVKITSFGVEDSEGKSVNVLQSGRNYTFTMQYTTDELREHDLEVVAIIELSDEKGTTVLLLSSDYTCGGLSILRRKGKIACLVEDFNLVAGDYHVTLYLGEKGGETLDGLNNIAAITVAGGDYFGTGHPGFPLHCKTLTRSKWHSSE
jgi:lipopolysaccharide transport system ATP-binding protein